MKRKGYCSVDDALQQKLKRLKPSKEIDFCFTASSKDFMYRLDRVGARYERAWQKY